MDFMIRYQGPLPSNGSIRAKQRIREAIHPQLEVLCAQQPLLADARRDELPAGVWKEGRVDVPRPLKVLFYSVQIGEFRFVPIIHRPHELVCSLDILFLRKEAPGAIVQGGDLDNRLKTLLDGLRMPRAESELGERRLGTSGSRMYCLLEDDSLITRLSVSTHQLLEPRSEGRDSDVELLIHVLVQSTYPMWGNLGI